MSKVNERFLQGDYLYSSMKKSTAIRRRVIAIIGGLTIFVIVFAIVLWLLSVCFLLIASTWMTPETVLEPWQPIVFLVVGCAIAFVLSACLALFSPLFLAFDAIANWAFGRERVMVFGDDFELRF